MLKKLACLFTLLCASYMHAQTIAVALTGTMQYASGAAFNGTIQLSIAKSSAVNTCTTPQQTVAKSTAIVSVVNGIVSNGTQFISSDCLGGVPYYVQIFDTKNKPVASGNWFIIGDITNLLNVGNLVLSNFGGPIVVSVPTPIISTPPSNQTITQPIGTSLSINRLSVTGTFTYPATTAFGYATLVAGTATVSTTAACTPSSTCTYYLTNCGTAGGGLAVGILSVGTVVPGTSFIINSYLTTKVTANDTSNVCWRIN